MHDIMKRQELIFYGGIGKTLSLHRSDTHRRRHMSWWLCFPFNFFSFHNDSSFLQLVKVNKQPSLKFVFIFRIYSFHLSYEQCNVKKMEIEAWYLRLKWVKKKTHHRIWDFETWKCEIFVNGIRSQSQDTS